MGILTWGQILNVKVPFTTLQKNLPFYLVNQIGVKKWLVENLISEWKRLLAIGNSNLGSNFECQSTIYNFAKKSPILFGESHWGQKVADQDWISERM